MDLINYLGNEMKKNLFFVLPLLFVVNLSAQSLDNNKPIQFNENDLVWRAGIPGTLIAILEGNPKSDSLYTIRLKIPANFIVRPHWHTSDERVTVLSGSVYVGFGDKIDRNKSKKFTVDGYYVNPPDIHHFVWTDEPAEIQITGIGPWVVKYIDSSK